MNKSDLVDYVSNELNITKTDVLQAINVVLAGIKKGLADTGEVRLENFGTFKVRERAAYSGKNPNTGEVIKVPATKVVRFSVHSELKVAVAPKKAKKAPAAKKEPAKKVVAKASAKAVAVKATASVKTASAKASPAKKAKK